MTREQAPAPPKDYRLAVRVRNNRLLTIMERCGYYSLADLSRASGVNYQEIAKLASLRGSFRTKRWQWRRPVMDLAAFLQCMPEDLAPLQHWDEPLETRAGEIEVDLEEVRLFLGGMWGAPALPDAGLKARDLSLAIETALHGLKPREVDIVRHRFELDGAELQTYDEIGDRYGITRERVRQIETRALRRMGKWQHDWSGEKCFTGEKIPYEDRLRLRQEFEALP